MNFYMHHGTERVIQETTKPTGLMHLNGCQRIAVGVFLAGVLLGGCTTRPEGPCVTRECTAKIVIQAVSKQCLSDLSDHHLLSFSERKRINKTYNYPFTNEKTYSSIMRRGGLGPSPLSWCRQYAEWRAGVRPARNT